MNVLIIGSGGREHALAWKIAGSPLLTRLYIAPGNAGTALHGENVPIPAEKNPQELVSFARSRKIDLVVVGPEAPLAGGLADELRAAGIATFGPSRLAAQIEASKAFAKDFMARHGIPSARYAVFDDFDKAAAYLRRAPYPVVIKASGLAAGKGVIVPNSPAEAESALHAMLKEAEFGSAGSQVIIEERLSGEEVSLLAFTDGRTLRAMPPAQDHKRLLDGDQGPNTGGMGAYAPAPVCPPELAAQLAGTILQPAVDGLRAEGRPFVGVLYAGLMLTPAGARVLEFNCRFGDPETQAILPLLESDLLELLLACVEGRLDQVGVSWSAGAAACVVLASENYPGKVPSGRAIHGLEQAGANGIIFHAGTRFVNGQTLTAGGRVLDVTAWGADLETALQRAYRLAREIHFEGCQYRSDIGRRALKRRSAYARAGVDIDAGERAVHLMKAAVRSTYGPQVLAGIGSFGGLFDAGELQTMQAPVLVASTDGVGTKVMLAAQAGRYETIGRDIVNHCINDILVQGARPLFFLDYIASPVLNPEIVAAVVSGMAAACREAGCALLGGETAEMPGVYAPGEFDVAGTIVGAVERAAILPRLDIQPGDVLVGLASTGPHTNGYSLIRKIFAGMPLESVHPELGIPLAEALLAPHRSYLDVLWPLLSREDRPIKALAHITGGGLVENIPRVLPEGMGVTVDRRAWPEPPLFRLIRQLGAVPEDEMYRIFNMGIGMLAITAPEQASALQAALGESSWVIGKVVELDAAEGERKVRLV